MAALEGRESAVNLVTQQGPISMTLLTGEDEAPQEAQAPAQAAAPDYTAELEKLAQLRDQGVITADDFEAKKKQVLGI